MIKIQLFTQYNKKLSNGFSFMKWDGKTYIRQGSKDLWLTKNMVDELLYKKIHNYLLGPEKDIVLDRDDLILISEAYDEFETDGREILPDSQFGDQ